MSRKLIPIAGFWYSAVLSIPHSWPMTAHICTAQASCGTGSRHTAFPPQHPQTALHICPQIQATSRSFSSHSPWKEHFPFPSSMHFPKEAVRKSDSRLSSPVHTFMRDHSRTPASPGPRNPTLSHKPVQQ